ncbi:hypothetical protein GOP47_0010939 [Adiantum capillus-veneris]|uniref:Uncharacterized protein n=1 Tax=Adiantum capillus-veneris TaxID=13818 RepID=A0A9D4ZGV0_ADICA|nr:hypothetical protein GOP47_0010939 [Adiantum capillus-veneris]
MRGQEVRRGVLVNTKERRHPWGVGSVLLRKATNSEVAIGQRELGKEGREPVWWWWLHEEELKGSHGQQVDDFISRGGSGGRPQGRAARGQSCREGEGRSRGQSCREGEGRRVAMREAKGN